MSACRPRRREWRRDTIRPVASTRPELQDAADAIHLIHQWVAASPLRVTVLPAPADTGHCLEALQVSTRSPLGALAFHTGGLLVDHGWLRVLGAGSAALPRALDRWNITADGPRCAEGLLVADDALGGFFAWFRSPRTVHSLAPDTLEWKDSTLGYTDWLDWALSGGIREFARDLRWPEWAREVEPLDGARALLVSPPLFTEQTPIAERARHAVPVEELWGLTQDLRRQLEGAPAGTALRLDVAGR
jgi:hypothetical protein